MELYTAASTSLVVEDYILKKLKFFNSLEDARDAPETGIPERPIYKVSITVEQVEPKL